MAILVDIGGTYARFALFKRGTPAHVQKITAADYPDFLRAVRDYAAQQSLKTAPLLIATAAHPDLNNIWRFVNENRWTLDPKALARAGFKPRLLLNDFEAGTWGLHGGLKALKHKKVLKRGTPLNDSLALIGPGTGLGIGYLTPQGKSFHVQKTLGGHIAAAAITAQQTEILEHVARVKKRPGPVVYEDVISGPGLMNLYRAQCRLKGRTPRAATPEALLDAVKRDARAHAALKFFHEFFGLFAANIAVAGDSYGGVCLTGGVMDRLCERGLFDQKTFEKFFVAPFVPSVRAALNATPIIHVTDPYLALRGLIHAARLSDD